MPADWPDYPDHAPDRRLSAPTTPTASAWPTRSGCGTPSTAGRPDAGGGWTVRADGPTGAVEVTVDAVVVANGHNRVPRLPDPPLPGRLHRRAAAQPRLPRARSSSPAGGSWSSAAATPRWTSPSTPRTPPSAPLLSLRRGVWVVPKYLLGRPSDTLNGALARRLPWRLRQRISQTMLRLAGRPARPLRAARARRTASCRTTRRSPTGCCPGCTHGEIDARPGDRRASTATGSRFADGRSDEVDLIVWCTGYRVDVPVPRPGAARRRRRPAAAVPARVPPRRARPDVRRADAVHRRGAARVEAQARLRRRAPGRPATRCPTRTGSAPTAAPSCAPPGTGGATGGPAMRIDFDAYLRRWRRDAASSRGMRRAHAAGAHGGDRWPAAGAGHRRERDLRQAAVRAAHRRGRPGGRPGPASPATPPACRCSAAT